VKRLRAAVPLLAPTADAEPWLRGMHIAGVFSTELPETTVEIMDLTFLKFNLFCSFICHTKRLLHCSAGSIKADNSTPLILLL
jgi:hypothetical protein